MSALPHTATAGTAAARRLLVVLALVAALAAAALTIAIVSLATDDASSSKADSATQVRVLPSAPAERRRFGGHGESIPVPAPRSPNDGSDHAGARP
jgi:hypothetical protein